MRSHGRPAADVGLLERFDGFAGLRNGLRKIADNTADWAGIPMPLDDLRLVVEPSFPNAPVLMAMGPKAEPIPPDCKHRNTFYSRRHRADIVIYEEKGRVKHGLVPAFHHLSQQLSTLGASVAWGIEQESRAIRLLAGMLPHHKYKQYLLTGMFLESSPRSNVCYLFRKLRPTVALDLKGEHVRIMCALCLHPIAYYEDSWAGAMCPTDDVIAHLALMRGDEPMFWRRSNQHPPHRPEAGL